MSDFRKRHSPRAFALAGIAIIAIVFVGFGGWAAFAPLSSAAIAPGQIAVEGDTKTIQHLEGGIVKDILVKDGDPVEAGQIVIRLEDTKARAELESLDAQLIALEAIASRLRAERDEQDMVVFPQWLGEAARTNPEAQAQMETQEKLFLTRFAQNTNQVAILRQQIAQKEEEIHGLESQRDGAQRKQNIIGDELKLLRAGAKRGVVRRRDLLSKEREAADIDGDFGRIRAEIARAKQSIAESEIKIIEEANKRLNSAVEELQRIQARHATLQEQRRAAEDVLNRVEIRAPRTGIVVGLAVNTAGGVVAPGEDLLSIVPQDETLVVSARVNPTDIDVVHAGLSAEVRLLAFSFRRPPTISATVRNVSADLLTDEATGESYYTADIRLNADELAAAGAELYPGMPVEAMIVTGERTALDYVTQPIIASTDRAFRED